MKTGIIYTENYRRNLELYWQQYYPMYEIPVGYHVHHIKPKCTFEDKNDSRIHHPRNLIALHPDDHVSIHKCRGDKQLSAPFMTSVIGRIPSTESVAKMSESQLKRFKEQPVTNTTRRKMAEAKQNITDRTRKKMSKSAQAKKATSATRAKMRINFTGEGNSRFKGYYVTPWGEFTSLDDARTPVVSRTAVQRWCNNSSKIISKQAIWQSPYLKDDDFGKTFNEIGFSFKSINITNNEEI